MNPSHISSGETYTPSPRIASVRVDDRPLMLHIQWDIGAASVVDVSGLVDTFRVYEPLRQSPDQFRQVQHGEHGTDIVFPDGIDMAADTLWCLAQEQAGVTMSPDGFRHSGQGLNGT